ncbi:arylsulfatase (plasmid) [Fulvitalea axinellae]|uniref:Arylsulfatase n=1 Tax=Fulvitalea axinellae TaxID=1182444 RepID=A0AAU9DFX6_9BACT|nr:arylsulfatase [Fulvitalea axinellae]
MEIKGILKRSFCYASAMLAGAVTAYAQTSGKPNIIHIMADDVGYDDIGIFGAKDIKTPNIDALAKKGKVFTNFYAPHGTCTPTRAAVLTGRYAPRVNDRQGLQVLFPTANTGLDPKEITVTELLQKEGYATALYGKWHLGHLPQYLPTSQGFDLFLGIPYPNDHGPERNAGQGLKEFPPIPLIRGKEPIMACDNNDLGELPQKFQREACRFIRDKAKTGQPFYLQYSNIETHTPWYVPKGFEGRSQAGPYGDAVEFLDGTVGAIMRTVRQMGIEDNTLIVFSSDNGPLVKRYPELEQCYGTAASVDTSRKHILRGGKYQSRYDGGTRVACVMVWPGKIPENTVSDEVIAGFDFFTTFAKMGGAEIPNDRIIDGRDIRPLMKGEQGAKSPHEVFFGYEAKGRLMSVRKGNWKLAIPNHGSYGIGRLKEYQLFNIKEDIGEKNNVIENHPKIVKELKRLAKEANKAIKEDKPMPLSVQAM